MSHAQQVKNTPPHAGQALNNDMPEKWQSRLAPVSELVAEVAAGRMVILVDDENRENEGDVILAADKVTPQAINFMASHCRGLICLTLTSERCEQLHLPPMVQQNGTRHGTAFTVSIEAATGVHTGISAADRARTIEAAVDPEATAASLVQPGHIFPLRASDGGVLARAGHTEAGCDLAKLAGLQAAAVICEIMNDDGTMARLPDLVLFAQKHQLKLGSIADLIRYRSQNEKLVSRVAQRELNTQFGSFHVHTYQDRYGGAHWALTLGQWKSEDTVLVRVHEPLLSLFDWLDVGNNTHSWSLTQALQKLQSAGAGVMLLLNAGQTPEDIIYAAKQEPTVAAVDAGADESDLRTYGLGAQILRDLNVSKMTVLGNPRRFPSLGAYGLSIEGFLTPDQGDNTQE